MSFRPEQRTVTELVGDAVNQFSKLIRNELAIARTELTAKATEAVLGIGLILGGAILLVPAMVLFLMALAAWLHDLGLSAPIANLLAGLVGLAIAGAIAFVGKRKLSPDNLKPQHTIREFERDVAAVKGSQR